WKPYARTGILMLVFLFFQTFVVAHHPLNLVVSGYYYGAIFSVLLAILLAGGLGTLLRGPRTRWLAVGAAGYLLFIQVSNFSAMNRSWMAHNNSTIMGFFALFTYNPYLAHSDMSEINRLFANSTPGLYVGDIPAPLRRHRRASVLELWKRRAGGYRDYLGSRPLALADAWLLAELYYMRTPGILRLENAAADPKDRMPLLLYAGVLARSHRGQPDEELPPVLAIRKLPTRGFGSYGFDSRLVYPWNGSDLDTGAQRVREMGYSHWLMPVPGAPGGPGPFWAFHNAFLKAAGERQLYEYGIIAVDQISVAGQELVVMDMR
ncbi:MAG: hypothetical protein Q8N51_10570, partial [Gammaproteobacteria bacterium]|nr:hypothetical protein [Gammaproteobacteria bacterium]